MSFYIRRFLDLLKLMNHNIIAMWGNPTLLNLFKKYCEK